MAITSTKCPFCGAITSVDDSKEVGFCGSCGKQIIKKNTHNSQNKIKMILNNARNKVKALTNNKQSKTIIILSAVLIFIVIIFSVIISSSIMNNSPERIAKRDIKTIQQHLKDPESIIIYSCYVNPHYSDKDIQISYIIFGARNSYGGITEDKVCVYGNNVEFQSDFDDAVAEHNNDKILTFQYLSFVQMNVLTHPEEWNKVDVEKLN